MHCWTLLLIAVLGLTPGNSDLVEEKRCHGDHRALNTRLITYAQDKGNGNRILTRAPDIRQARLLNDIDSVHRRTSNRFREDTRTTTVEHSYLQKVRHVAERTSTDRNSVVRRDLRNNDDFRRQSSRLATDDRREYRNLENIERAFSYSRKENRDGSEKLASGINTLSRNSRDLDKKSDNRNSIYLDVERRQVKSHSENKHFGHIEARDLRHARARYSSDNDHVSRGGIIEENRDIQRSPSNERFSRVDARTRNTIRHDSKFSHEREQFIDRNLRIKRDTGSEESRQHHIRRYADASNRNIAVSRRETNNNDGTRNDRTNINTVRSDVITRKATSAYESTDRRLERSNSRLPIQRTFYHSYEAIRRNPPDRRNHLAERRSALSDSENSRRATQKSIDARSSTRLNTRGDQTGVSTRRSSAKHVKAQSDQILRGIHSKTTSSLNRLQSVSERDDRRSDIELRQLPMKRSDVETRMDRSLNLDTRTCSLNHRATESEVCSSERQFSHKFMELHEARRIRSRSVPFTLIRHDTRHNRVELRLTTSNDQRRSVRPTTERDDTRRNLVELRTARSNDQSRSILSTSKRDDTRRNPTELLSTRFSVQSRSILSTDRDDTRSNLLELRSRMSSDRNRFVLSNSERDDTQRNYAKLSSKRLIVPKRSIISKERDDNRRNYAELPSKRLSVSKRSIISTERDDTRRSLEELRSRMSNDRSRSILSTPKRGDTRRNDAELSPTRRSVQSRSILSAERDDIRRNIVRQLYRVTEERTHARSERPSRLTTEREDDRYIHDRRSLSASKSDDKSTEERRLTRFRMPREIRWTAHSIERINQRRSTDPTELRQSIRAIERQDSQFSGERTDRFTTRSLTRLESRRINDHLLNAERDMERRTFNRDAEHVTQRQTVNQLAYTRRENTRLNNERHLHLTAVQRANKRIETRDNIRSTESRESFTDLLRSKETRENVAVTRDNNRHDHNEEQIRFTIERDELGRKVDRHNDIRYSTRLLHRNTHDKAVRSVTDKEESRWSIRREDTRSGRQDNRRNLDKFAHTVNERSDQRQNNRRSYDLQLARSSIERVEIQREHSDSSSTGVNNRRNSERRIDSIEARSRRQSSVKRVEVQSRKHGDSSRIGENTRQIRSTSELANYRRISESRIGNVDARSRSKSSDERVEIQSGEYSASFSTRINTRLILTAAERRMNSVEARSERKQMMRTIDRSTTMENRRIIESQHSRKTNRLSTDRNAFTNNMFRIISGKNIQLQETRDTSAQMESRQTNPIFESRYNIVAKDTNEKELETEAYIFNWQYLFYILQGSYLLAVFLQTRMDDGCDKLKKRNWIWWNPTLHVKLD